MRKYITLKTWKSRNLLISISWLCNCPNKYLTKLSYIKTFISLQLNIHWNPYDCHVHDLLDKNGYQDQQGSPRRSLSKRCQRALVGTMVSQTEADPGYPPGLVPYLGRLPDGEIFAALVWSNKLSVMGSMVWPDEINADTGSLKKRSECYCPLWILD